MGSGDDVVGGGAHPSEAHDPHLDPILRSSSIKSTRRSGAGPAHRSACHPEKALQGMQIDLPKAAAGVHLDREPAVDHGRLEEITRPDEHRGDH